MTNNISLSQYQVPLALAWAMSIHKAQGQTISRVKVDLNRVFEKGKPRPRAPHAHRLSFLMNLILADPPRHGHTTRAELRCAVPCRQPRRAPGTGLRREEGCRAPPRGRVEQKRRPVDTIRPDLDPTCTYSLLALWRCHLGRVILLLPFQRWNISQSPSEYYVLFTSNLFIFNFVFIFI